MTPAPADGDALREAETAALRLEQERAERAALPARFDAVCRTPADPGAVSARVQWILVLAGAEAAEILAEARTASAPARVRTAA